MAADLKKVHLPVMAWYIGAFEQDQLLSHRLAVCASVR
jgi:hypothetical protein